MTIYANLSTGILTLWFELLYYKADHGQLYFPWWSFDNIITFYLWVSQIILLAEQPLRQLMVHYWDEQGMSFSRAIFNSSSS